MSDVEDREKEAGAPLFTKTRITHGFLFAIVVGVTALFLVMLRDFLITLMLGAIFAGMTRPAFLALTERLGGRPRLAATATVLGLVLLIVVPLGGFLALVVAQAIELTEIAGPWIREQFSRWPEISARLEGVPILGDLIPDRATLLSRTSELVSRTGTILINSLGAATTGTMTLVLQLFVMLYALYYFLLDGPAMLSRLLYFTPLDDADEQRLIGQFVSVTRATIKGSILVGLIQGALAGGAFFVLGLPAAAFWSTIMAVLSVIPVLGSGIVWAPAAVILALTGRLAAGVGLALWGLLIVGLVDNFLRPRFVGRDTKMHDLLVLLSTFGGLAMFGLVGFIVGPIIAAIFMTVWDLYGVAFKSYLPAAPNPVVASADGNATGASAVE